MIGPGLRSVLVICVFGASGQVAVAAGNRVLPFWAQPYPSTYAYDRPLPQPECYAWITQDTPFGPRRERVWTCGAVVRSRY